MEALIRLDNVHYTYNAAGDNPVAALNGVNLVINPGEYVVILGHNGSGKSTLARHLNALLTPTGGEVWVKEWNTKDAAALRDIRTTVGMVFQTPDNQIVATIVEEDVAFGPENLGLPFAEIAARVDGALGRVELTELRKRAPHLLSGGQKQRVCIAGVLAMQPDVLVLDEATAMLDPHGRKDVLALAHNLNRREGTTVVAITHFMEEAIHADRLVIMAEGKIVLDGPPRSIFAQAATLRKLQLGVPQVTQLAHALHSVAPAFPQEILTPEEFVAAWRQLGVVEAKTEAKDEAKTETETEDEAEAKDEAKTETEDEDKTVIELRAVAHDYMHGTPLEVRAIDNVNMTVRRGEVLGVLGHTGSGKSTIIQHFNALLKPHEGVVTVFGQDTTRLGNSVRDLRRRVGLVFQQPEAQLFERYVGDDVAYGPRNLKLPKETIRTQVRAAMESVGLGFEAYKDRMTMGLSGGQKRRVALAGVLALEPEVLVLDEPTAGLDPAGRRQLLELILRQVDAGVTLVMISHNMEELAEICDRLYVIADGTASMSGTVDRIFGQGAELQTLGLDVPGVTAVMTALAAAGFLTAAEAAVYTVADATALLEGKLRAGL